MKTIKAYVWQDVPNWGDQLGAYIFKYFLGDQFNIELVDRAADSDLIGIGSTLQHLPDNYGGVIVGTGKLQDKPLNKTFPNATILGVRGSYSLDPDQMTEDLVLGDPGLITPQVSTYSNGISKQWDIGILPHWSDTALKYDRRFYGPWTTKFISPFRHPIEVYYEILQCTKLVTSSLHGVIVADALGIPRRIVPAWQMRANVWEGGMFKFKDYMSALNMEYKPEVLERADPYQVELVQADILKMYQILPNILNENITSNT